MLTPIGVFGVRSVRLCIDAYTVRALADLGEDFLTAEGAEAERRLRGRKGGVVIFVASDLANYAAPLG